MVRKYVPKKSARHPDKDKRMTRAVELRGMGWSLRRIADRLAISVGTVHGDLKRWERERPNVTPLRSNPPFKSAPTGASLNAEIEHPDSNVIRIRRSS